MGGVILFVMLATLLSKFNVSVWEFNKRTFLAASIYLLGFMMRKYSEKILFYKSYVAIVGIGIVTIATLLYPKNMTTAQTFIDLWYFLFVCMCGIFAIFAISQMLSKSVHKDFFVFTGQNTLVILALHFICFKLINFAKIWYYGLDFDMLSCFPIIFEHNNPLWMLLYCVAGIFIPLAIPAIKSFTQTKLNQLHIR